jgi:hypothetical protein
MVRKFSEYRTKEFERRKLINALGFSMWVVSLEDLILSKIIWIQEYQSERQMEDVRNLLRNESVDIVYIKDWANKLSVNLFNLI